MHECKPCGLKNLNADDLHLHLLSTAHSRTGNYRCTLCDCGTTSNDNFIAHLKGKSHQKKLKEATNCKNTSPFNQEGDSYYCCQLCGQFFHSESAYMMHLSVECCIDAFVAANPDQTRIECTICQNFTSGISNFKKHLLSAKHIKKMMNSRSAEFQSRRTMTPSGLDTQGQASTSPTQSSLQQKPSGSLLQNMKAAANCTVTQGPMQSEENCRARVSGAKYCKSEERIEKYRNDQMEELMKLFQLSKLEDERQLPEKCPMCIGTAVPRGFQNWFTHVAGSKHKNNERIFVHHKTQTLDVQPSSTTSSQNL